MTQLTAYDKLGNAVTLDVCLSYTGTNTWGVDVFNSSAITFTPSGSTSGTYSYTAAPLASSLLTFNTSGVLTTVTPAGPSSDPLSMSIPVPGGNTMTLDMSQTTQLATAYTVSQATTNGSAASAFSQISIDSKGNISAVYQNGATIPLYSIPLATVPNPDGMAVVTGNAFQTNTASGSLVVGAAGQNGIGTLQTSSLESSTVDLSSELTAMIEAQNNYQANSKVFETGSKLLEVLVNLQQ